VPAGEKSVEPVLARTVRPFLLAWFICLLLMEFIGAGFVGGGIYTEFDFEEYYNAGSLIRTNPSQLYDLAQQERIQQAHDPHSSFVPSYHPAYEGIFFAPFSLLSYRTAYLSFIACNMLLLLAAFFVLQPAAPPNFPSLKSRPWLMFFLFLPLLIAVAHGQDSILLLLLFCLTWRQLESGKDFNAGCFAALALFKFQIAIPIAVLIAVRRSWRFSAGFLTVSAGLALLSIDVVGPAGTLDFTKLIYRAVSAIDKSRAAPHGMEIIPSALTNLAGLLYGCGGSSLGSSLAFDALVGTCSLGLLAWCVAVIRRSEQRVAFSIAILCGLMVSYHLFIYDLTLALLPVALLAGRIHRYILMSLFILPLVLLGLGPHWTFLMAVPMLAMLVNTTISSHEPLASEPRMRLGSPQVLAS
jgi:hypothetical protein